MPAVSEKQRKLFGLALAIKRGKASGSKKARELAEKLSEKQLKDFAKKTKRK
jgi:hypothetical protein